MTVEKAKNYIRVNFFFLVVALAAIVYLIRGFVTVVQTGKSVVEVLADGALGAIFAFLIGKLMSLQGLIKGENNQQVLATARLHADTVNEVAGYIDRLDEWCDLKNQEAMRMQRTKLLAQGGVGWDEYCSGLYVVTTDGIKRTVGYKQLPSVKKRAVRRAQRLHLTPLSAGALTSDGGKNNDPYDFGIDKSQYQRRRDMRQIVGKVVCGLLFGYYGVQLITDFSWSQLIWTALQVAAFLSMGVIAYMQAYFFVVDYDRHRVIRKIDNLQKFKVWSEQQKGVQSNET